MKVGHGASLPFLLVMFLGLDVVTAMLHEREDSMVRGGGLLTSPGGQNTHFDQAAVVAQEVKPSFSHREAQEEPNYFADYVGRFQYQRNALCVGPYPELVATCRGTIELQSVSDDTFISCDDVVQNEDETTSIRCITTCSLNQCLGVFLSLDVGVDAPYGEIYFRCAGETILEAEGTFSYLETGTGGCSPFEDDTRTRSYHYAQLGVLCDENEYLFDGYFFECNKNFVDNIRAPDGSPMYTCWSGKDCRGQECIVVFEDLVVQAEVQNFQERCVSSPKGLALTSSPTPPPQERRRMLVTEFQFVHGVQSTGEVSLGCGIEYPTVTLRCTNGAIALVESTLGVNPCDRVDDQTLVCEGKQGLQLLGKTDYVTYTCTSSTSPMTFAELSEATASCSNIRQYGELGVFCLGVDQGKPAFVYIDLFFECGPNVGYTLGEVGNALSCISNAAETSGSILSGVSVTTGRSWRAQPFLDTCTLVSTPSATTAPSTTVIDVEAGDGETDDDDKDDGSKTVVTIVAVVGTLAVVVLLAILYMVCRNKGKEENSQTKASDNAVSFGPSETSRHVGYDGQSSSGVPGPLANDYGSMYGSESHGIDGHQTIPGGVNQAVVQVADVISVDGPIADAEPIPHLYFPRADASDASDATRNANDTGVRFKDQAAEVPSSALHHGAPSPISSLDSQSNTHSNSSPHLQQGLSIDAERIDLPNDNTDSNPGVVPSSRRKTETDDFAPDTESAQYKDQAQSVIGEVQAVVEDQSVADPSMIPMEPRSNFVDPSMIPIEPGSNASLTENEPSSSEAPKVAEASGEGSMLAI